MGVYHWADHDREPLASYKGSVQNWGVHVKCQHSCQENPLKTASCIPFCHVEKELRLVADLYFSLVCLQEV